jgi:hypothetical protein
MYLDAVESDQLYTWSDGYTETTRCRPAKTPRCPSAPIAAAHSHLARLPHRTLQTMWQAGVQMRRRPRPWAQVLSVGKLPGLAAANGLRAAGVPRTSCGVPRQLSPSSRDPGGNLRDQPRTPAPSRGSLKTRHERIIGCPPPPDRCGNGRHAPRQHARRLARWQSNRFVPCGGSR